ncbi:aldo/keto reductase [Falsihalocynthiibacter arcticus]|uniref:Pyridoxal 4-dehydrogenase n=1 Tax=Falsihalocynthiibacter arcticus TaxID=1579316 RepID=A0A126V1U9_9RHOB|nr:aldo/keto reductase [Falsihalocynthiibacter arcticus]AML51846.1 pyridoxal 4-dehydrogenase [Falsihalocynthiibacter arcticus]
MKRRILGKTGLELTELSFGAGAIGNLYAPVTQQAAHDVMEVSWASGIRYFDTAPFYGHGRSERRVGDFLRGRSEYVLSTKVGKLLTPVSNENIPDYGFVDPLPFAVHFDYSYDGIMKSFEMSLARLGLNRIDILYVHDLEPSGFSEAEYNHHLTDFLDGGIRALNELKDRGYIRAFGLGINQVSACLNVLSRADIDVILLAGRYTLLDRSAELALLAECRKRNVALVIGGVFNSGILAVGPKEGACFDYQPASSDILQKVGSIQETLKVSDVDLAQAALQFPLQSDLVATVLIGSAKASSMLRNVKLLSPSVPSSVFETVEKFTLHQ